IVDEAQLHPAVVGKRKAFANRNALVPELDTRLKQAVADGRLSEAERSILRKTVGQAFPPIDPPPGRSYVVIPARVFASAAQRWEADSKAGWDRRASAEFTQQMLSSLRARLRDRGGKKGASMQELAGLDAILAELMRHMPDLKG